MKFPQNLISTLKNQQGVVAILVGFAMIFLISFAALAVDIGYVLTTKNELQNIADAAALASAGRLLEFYSPPREPIIESSVEFVANTVASMNWAGGEEGGCDIEIGTWDRQGNDGFTEISINAHATRVTARKDDVRTFFAKLFGIGSVDIQAEAIAIVPGYSFRGIFYPNENAHPILVK